MLRMVQSLLKFCTFRAQFHAQRWAWKHSQRFYNLGFMLRLRNCALLSLRMFSKSFITSGPGQHGVSYKNDNSIHLCFRIMSPDPYFSFIFVSGATVLNILMILGRIIKEISMECRVQEWQLCLSSFWQNVPWSIFLLHFPSKTLQPFEIF